jgi:hypothetical protein
MAQEESLPPIEYDIGERLPQIEAELDARLEQRLSEKDRLAITAAVTKAAARGFGRGLAIAYQQVNTTLAQTDVTLESVEIDLPDFGAERVDQWAEKYGETRA